MCTIPELMKFLDIQRKSGNLKDQFTVLDVFDDIIPSIRELYDAKISKEEEDQEDFGEDLGLEDIVSGVPLRVGIFYHRVFLPHCIYYMYRGLLSKCSADPETLFKELFSIGAGSASHDLSPEVTAICDKCVEKKFPYLFLKDDTDIKRVNIEFYKCQVKDNFILNPNSGAEEGGSDDHISNPFDNSGIENTSDWNIEDESDFKISQYVCEECFQSFPASDFLTLHVKVFHSITVSSNDVEVVSTSNRYVESAKLSKKQEGTRLTRKPVKTTFVGNADCMITSFHNSDSPDSVKNLELTVPPIVKNSKDFVFDAKLRKVKYNLRSKF